MATGTCRGRAPAPAEGKAPRGTRPASRAAPPPPSPPPPAPEAAGSGSSASSAPPPPARCLCSSGASCTTTRAPGTARRPASGGGVRGQTGRWMEGPEEEEEERGPEEHLSCPLTCFMSILTSGIRHGHKRPPAGSPVGSGDVNNRISSSDTVGRDPVTAIVVMLKGTEA
ncbi:hypothetical protein EYF80_042112 [Liparis tanakae]|uniref:Uncharacterized protein n=1 Tax=Liparis tanakae TaxID=230148 RepID=A0A4Z2G293_9TELE|nr:hypothetical protein EYF80_042112 [Liparis tanakae]